MKTLPVVRKQARQVDVAASLAGEKCRQGDPGRRLFVTSYVSTARCPRLTQLSTR